MNMSWQFKVLRIFIVEAFFVSVHDVENIAHSFPGNLKVLKIKHDIKFDKHLAEE